MKQSIRPTRATLYFQFIALRDLNLVRAGATPQRMFKKWKRHGEADVKVWAFTVHSNGKKINGFRWKGSCFMVSHFCSNLNCQKTQLRVHVYKKNWQCCSLRDILVACGERASQAKSKSLRL